MPVSPQLSLEKKEIWYKGKGSIGCFVVVVRIWIWKIINTKQTVQKKFRSCFSVILKNKPSLFARAWTIFLEYGYGVFFCETRKERNRRFFSNIAIRPIPDESRL